MKRYVGVVCLVMVVLTGCNPMIWRLGLNTNGEAEEHAMQAAHELDKISRDLDEYGSISASTAAIIRSPGNEFKFDLDLTPKQLFEQRPLQGFSSVRNYEELAVRVAAAVAILKTGQVSEANQALAQALVGADMGGMSAGSDDGSTSADTSSETDTAGGESSTGNGTETSDTTPSADSAAAEEDPLANAPKAQLPEGRPSAIPEKFSDPLKVPDPSTLGLSMRDLIKRVFDDHTTLKLFEWLSEPNEESLGKNKQLYAAVLNVSIRPGRSTYQGYTGEIDIRPEYAGKDPKSGKTLRGDGHPLAFAVFPAIDSQVLDLRTSLRKQFALATLLEAAFPAAATGGLFGGSGSLASDYVKRLEQDAASLSAVNTVVGYNASGRHFGWRFSPSFVAQSDPTDLETGPASMLQAQSFPALVLILADKEDLHKELGGAWEGSKNDEKKIFPELKMKEEPNPLIHRIGPPYDHLSFFFSVRWFRAPSPRADESYVPFRSGYNRFTHPRLEESQIAEWGLRLGRAQGWILAAEQADTTGYGRYATTSLRKRFNMLQAASIGVDTFWSLPHKPTPVIALSSISPRRGWVDQESWFVLQGKGFEKDKMKVFIGGREATVKDVNSKGTAALISVRKSFEPGKKEALDVTIRHTELGAASLNDAVIFNLPKKPSTPAKPKARFEVTWEKGADGKPLMKALSVYDNVTAKEVLDALTKQAPATTKADVKIDLDVNATGAY